MIVVDRFEGDFAILESNGSLISVPLTKLPSNIKEGDFLLEIKKGCYIIDNTIKKVHVRNISNKFNSLLKRPKT